MADSYSWVLLKRRRNDAAKSITEIEHHRFSHNSVTESLARSSRSCWRRKAAGRSRSGDAGTTVLSLSILVNTHESHLLLLLEKRTFIRTSRSWRERDWTVPNVPYMGGPSLKQSLVSHMSRWYKKVLN